MVYVVLLKAAACEAISKVSRKEIMKMKKPLIVAGVLSSVTLASLAGVSAVSAEASTSSDRDSIISQIATKFNLQESEVKAVFEEERTARTAERTKAIEAILTQAVNDGKLTDEQKDKILAKRAELQSERAANHDELKDKTAEERRTAMKTKRMELEKWATGNGISPEYIRYVFGHGGGHHGMGMGRRADH